MSTDIEPIIAPGPILQAVSLGDIRAAVLKYLETSVTSTVTEVVPEKPGVMNPEDTGLFTVRVRNAEEPEGVRMVDLRYHLTVNPPGSALFQVPDSPVARLSIDDDGAELTPGGYFRELFLFPSNPVLEVGDVDVVADLRLRVDQLGKIEVGCHVHTRPDIDHLFPRDVNKVGTYEFTSS